MKERQGEQGRPNQELTIQRNTIREVQGGNRPESASNNPFNPLMERQVFDRLAKTPAGEDQAFWPIPVLNDFNYLIVNKGYIKTDNPEGRFKHEFAKQAAPMRETIRKVTTAYEIIAYPYCKQAGRRDNIEQDLATDQQLFDRSSVKLSDEEVDMLGKLATARKIPFDSEKRVYNYSEIINQLPKEKILFQKK